MENVRIEDIQKIIATHLEKTEVAPSDRLKEDLKAEEADIMNILATIENQYDIVVEENDLMRLKSAKDLVKYVFAKM